MAWFWDGLRQMVGVVLIASLVELVLPEGALRKGAAMVSGLLMLCVLVGMIQSGLSVAFQKTYPSASAFGRQDAARLDAYDDVLSRLEESS